MVKQVGIRSRIGTLDEETSSSKEEITKLV